MYNEIDVFTDQATQNYDTDSNIDPEIITKNSGT